MLSDEMLLAVRVATEARRKTKAWLCGTHRVVIQQKVPLWWIECPWSTLPPLLLTAKVVQSFFCCILVGWVFNAVIEEFLFIGYGEILILP